MDTRALQLVDQEQLSNVPDYAALDISQTSELSPPFASTHIPFAPFRDFEPDRGDRI
jgi:hypothetical protein